MEVLQGRPTDEAGRVEKEIAVYVLLDKLDTHGSEDFKIDKDKEFHGQWETLMKAREEYYKSASQVLLKDL